jgi:hypothetical protein
MKIIGCDFHPSFQQIAMVDTETGEQRWLVEHKRKSSHRMIENEKRESWFMQWKQDN